MRRINSVRFVDVPDQVMDLSMGEYYLHDNCQRKAKVLPLTDCFKIRDRVYVSKDGDRYTVFYSNYYSISPVEQHFKFVMTLNKGEYGRSVYNEREVTFDDEWFYIRRTINLFYTDISIFRTKLFYRKYADFLFEDMDYLHYCGDYHKA